MAIGIWQRSEVCREGPNFCFVRLGMFFCLSILQLTITGAFFRVAANVFAYVAEFKVITSPGSTKLSLKHYDLQIAKPDIGYMRPVFKIMLRGLFNPATK